MLTLDVNELLAYTEWERGLWLEWLRRHGDAVLKTCAGPHGDGRFQTIGDCVRHIFSAEKRYGDRLSNRPVTDTSSIPTDNIEALFQFGAQSRRDLRKLIETFPPSSWDAPVEMKMMNSIVRATPKKIVAHVLMHESRHWAQITTLFRINGLKTDFHDLLFSPAFGGEVVREQTA